MCEVHANCAGKASSLAPETLPKLVFYFLENFSSCLQLLFIIEKKLIKLIIFTN